MIAGKYIYGNEDISECLKIREEVFVKEQGVPREAELDGLDEFALHVLVLSDDEPVATGRMYFDGKQMKIGRMCVKQGYRKKGLGELTMRMLLYKFLQQDIDEAGVSAQTHAKPFYERFGFKAVGDVYEECGIKHIRMTAKKEDITLNRCCD